MAKQDQATVLTGGRIPIRPRRHKRKRDVPTGTGEKYLRYLALGGRPGRARARTSTMQMPKLQRQVRSSVGADQLNELKAEVKALKEQIQGEMR